MTASHQPFTRAVLAIAVMSLIWGSNWPILKMAVIDLAPLTFRAITLPFAALGILAVAHLSGETVSIPRAWWGKLAALALFNIALWNGLVLFGVQLMPAGRSVILAYTMPIWATVIATFMLDEPLSPRKLLGLALGMCGMALLIGEEVRVIGNAPFGALMIVAAALSWAFGTVLLRKWKPPIAQNALTGWMILLGWMPLAVLAPWFDPQPVGAALAHMSGRTWFAVLYNVFLAGTIGHWVWFTVARKVPVALSSLASLPVPVIGVFAGMIVLHERPGAQEWISLGLVVAALFTVLFQPGDRKAVAAPMGPVD